MNQPFVQCMHRISARRVAAAGVVALAVAMGIGRFGFTPLLPLMQDDYGLSVGQGAWLATANYLGYLAGALLTTAWRLPPAIAIRGGLAAIGVTTAAVALNAGFAGWLLLRGLAGIASAVVMIHIAAWCSERFEAAHAPALHGAVFSGVGFGIAGVGALVLALAPLQVGAARSWAILGIASLAAWLAVNAAIADAGKRPTAPQSTAYSHWNLDTDTVCIVGCFGVAGFGYIVPATFIPVMARQVVADPALFTLAWPVFGAAAAASTFAASVLVRRFGNRNVWFASHIIMAIGVILPALSSRLMAVVAASLLVGSTFMVITMCAVREARAQAGPESIGLLGMMTAAFAVGQLVGPVCAALLVRHGLGLPYTLAIAAILLVASAAVLRTCRRQPALKPTVHATEQP